MCVTIPEGDPAHPYKGMMKKENGTLAEAIPCLNPGKVQKCTKGLHPKSSEEAGEVKVMKVTLQRHNYINSGKMHMTYVV